MEKEIKTLEKTVYYSFLIVYCFSLLWFLVLNYNLHNATDKIEMLQESVNKQRQEIADIRIFISELEDSDGE